MSNLRSPNTAVYGLSVEKTYFFQEFMRRPTVSLTFPDSEIFLFQAILWILTPALRGAKERSDEGTEQRRCSALPSNAKLDGHFISAPHRATVGGMV